VLERYAKFLSDSGLTAEAILRYQELVIRNPENATYRVLLGNAYLAAGLNSHALAAYMKGNELAGEKEGWILGNIGNILKNQGFHGEAIKYLNKAVERNPDSQYAHERLAQAQKLELEETERLSALLQEARASLGATKGNHPSPAA
jgi:tetratricopeptide (TPR) repeat protein